MSINLSRLNLIDRLLGPIQKLIRAILPDFIEKKLEDSEVRKTIVLAVDTALITQYPIARAIPSELRRAIIEKQLNIIIDDIVLGPNDAFEQLIQS